MNTNKIDYDSAENQDIKRKFVEREVIYCASTLVYELAQKAEHFPDYQDDLYGAFEGLPDYEEAAQSDDWRKASDGTFYKEDINQYYLSVNLQERGQIYVSVHHVTEPGQGSNGAEVWSFSGTEDEAVNLDGSEELDITDPDELLEYLQGLDILDEDADLSTDEGCNFETSNADDWQELCDTESVDVDDYRSEIYEHWIVTDYLARKLEDHGHKVMRDFFGMTIWCRPTTGQAILLDGVISEICAEMEILEGQANDWSKRS